MHNLLVLITYSQPPHQPPPTPNPSVTNVWISECDCQQGHYRNVTVKGGARQETPVHVSPFKVFLSQLHFQVRLNYVYHIRAQVIRVLCAILQYLNAMHCKPQTSIQLERQVSLSPYLESRLDVTDLSLKSRFTSVPLSYCSVSL